MNVAYWRTDRLAQRWLGRFEIIDPAQLFKLDEWQGLVEDAFKCFQSCFDSSREKFALHCSIVGVKVDFSNNWRQWLAINYEERFLFLSLASRWLSARAGGGMVRERCYIAENMFDRLSKAIGLSLPFPALVRPVMLFAWIDQAWQWSLALIQGCRQLLFLSRSGGAGAKATAQYLWSGMSPVEVPEGKNKLNFAFLTERALILPEECLYVLPCNPSQQALKRLEEQNIRWTLVSSYELLPVMMRFHAALSLGWTAIREFATWGERFKRPFAMQCCFEGTPWVFMVNVLKPETYLTSVSFSWPEPPEVAVMNTLGVRTINWSYGANSFCYSESDPDFQDYALARSISVAKEVWVWNEEVRELLEARALCREQSIRLTGPVMCGDSRWLNTPPADVRAACGIRTLRDTCFISVFDVPPVSKHIRLKIGHGPSMYPLEMLENFYNDIHALVERFADVTLIMKPKRALDDPSRDYPEGMNVLLDPQGFYIKQGRIILLDHDIDPYLPVAMADICLGVPFTSPVLVGLNAGRGGIYHDPLGKVNHFRPSVMAKFVTHSRNELLERVQRFLDIEQAAGTQKIKDPGEQFAWMLKTGKLTH